MKPLKAGPPILAAVLMLALPSSALAGTVVPPGNPAAIQYTEAFPTSRGPTDAENSGRGTSPQKSLGGRNARRLESEGRDGREAARVVAATAPPTGAARATGTSPASRRHSTGKGNEGGSGISQEGGGAAGPAAANPAVAGHGGSGVGEVAGQATGLDSSEATGLLLPLVLLAILAWGSAYVLRRRKRTAQ